MKKRLLLVSALAWVSVATLSGSPEGLHVWFKFNKAFINAHCTDGEAFGTIKGQTWGAAKTVHSTKCGSIDGELHVGALEGGVTLPASQSPISGKATSEIRAGASCSSYLTRKRAKVRGRWNEGHWKGQVHPSNPHHVFEVHPAWRFAFQGDSFDEPSLIRTMAGYRGTDSQNTRRFWMKSETR